VGETFAAMHARYRRLRSRSFYLHHYTEYMEVGDMDAAAEDVAALADEYAALDTGGSSAAAAPAGRLAPVGVGRS
jgi:tubulin epsilon